MFKCLKAVTNFLTVLLPSTAIRPPYLGKNSDIKFTFLNNYELNQDLVKKHCILGYEFTRNLEILKDMGDIILYHHHKWSGDNFNSVKGDKIPLASRIIFLADRIDALIGDENGR